MKDIDFDELDRAVGSVLGADPAAAPKDADTVVAETKPAEPVAVATAPSKPEEPASTPTIKPATSPARKRGQFLDMVHPSADMRGSKSAMPTGPRKTLAPLNPSVTSSEPQETKDTAPAEPVSSEASVVEPAVADVVKPVEAKEEKSSTLDTAEVAVEQEPAKTDEPKRDESKKTDEPAWPDPLDVTTNNYGTDGDDTEATDTDIEAVDESTNQTPFVPGVEVEKRPLGGGPSVDPPAPTTPLTSPDVSEEPAEPEQATPQVAPSPSDLTGPEMSEEINSIESNGVEESQAPADTVPLPSASQEAAAPAPEKPADEPKPETKAAPAAPDAPVGAQSIPQQYKPAEKTSEDDENHPLFDAQEYHQPLLPTGKKKSGKGILLIVLFVILVLVGCALGYLAFNMGL